MALQAHTLPINGFIETGFKASYVSRSTGGYVHHNKSATPYYPKGMKVRYYNETLEGYGTCIYLKYSEGAETLAAGYPVGIDEANDTNYSVTGDQSTIGDGTPLAIALSAMTDTYWGWFWCGGVCPDFYTSASAKFSATTVTTDNSIAAGKAFELPLSTTDGVIVVATNDATITKGGYALADDGGTTTDMANLVLYDHWG
jgi:hypothetical protein